MSVIYLFKNFAYIYIQVQWILLRCDMPSRAIGRTPIYPRILMSQLSTPVSNTRS